jgi:hypothetical protein
VEVSQIPVYIVCRDRVSDLRLLVAWLLEAGMQSITLLDNASTYPPLLEYYSLLESGYALDFPVKVVRLGRNLGHLALFQSGLQPPGAFFLSDPDLIPLGPPSGIHYLWELSQRYPAFQKLGFGLELEGATMPQPVLEAERGFWAPQLRLEAGVYRAPIDTTFALWLPGRQLNGIRTGHPHVMRHTSYFTDYSRLDLLSEEERYYLAHVEGTTSGWAEDIKRYG